VNVMPERTKLCFQMLQVRDFCVSGSLSHL
jgi:hypothetical protein